MNKSNFSMIRQRLNELFGTKDRSRRRQLAKELTLRARDIDFLRAEVFLDDLVAVSGEDVAALTLPVLICLLYEDFLQEVRNTFDVEAMLQRLNEKRIQHFRKGCEADFDNIRMRSKWISYPLVMKRSLALRGEVFLHDLAMHSGSFEMTIDELLSILFMDFMGEVRKGNQRKLMKLIISRLEEW